MENMVPGVMQLVDGMKMIWDIGQATVRGVSGVDTAWLRMDRRTNLMMIVGVLMFEERMDYERLRAVLEERFLHYERFAACGENRHLALGERPAVRAAESSAGDRPAGRCRQG